MIQQRLDDIFLTDPTRTRVRHRSAPTPDLYDLRLPPLQPLETSDALGPGPFRSASQRHLPSLRVVLEQCLNTFVDRSPSAPARHVAPPMRSTSMPCAQNGQSWQALSSTYDSPWARPFAARSSERSQDTAKFQPLSVEDMSNLSTKVCASVTESCSVPDQNRSASLASDDSSHGGVGIRTVNIPEKGMCYVWPDNTYSQIMIDDIAVDPALGTSKSGRPRKRSAIACKNCQRKKIRCEFTPSGCLQCIKTGRSCKMNTKPPYGHEHLRDLSLPADDGSSRTARYGNTLQPV